MIKLVISDMDGTLIDRDETLSKDAISMVRELRKKGIYFTIATGRSESIAEDYVKKLQIDIPYIACNGVTIVQKEKVLKRMQIPILGLKDLIEKADHMGMSIVYSIEGKEIVYKVTPWIMKQREEFHRYYETHCLSEEEWKNMYIDKLMVMDDVRLGSIKEVEDLCQNLGSGYGYTRYTNKSIELVHEHATKASALEEVLKMLDLSKEEVLAIGDHQNDIEMLQMAGIGVAVSNAIPELKEVADDVMDSSCVLGVLEAVKKYCF